MQLNGLAGYSTMASNTNSGANICAGCNQVCSVKLSKLNFIRVECSNSNIPIITMGKHNVGLFD